MSLIWIKILMSNNPKVIDLANLVSQFYQLDPDQIIAYWL